MISFCTFLLFSSDLNSNRISFLPSQGSFAGFSDFLSAVRTLKITELKLTHERFESDALSTITSFSSLTSLDLSYCPNVKDNHIEEILSRNRLVSLKLSYCSSLSCQTFDMIRRFGENISRLSLNWVGSGKLVLPFRDLLQNCSKIQELECAGAHPVAFENIFYPSLLVLNLKSVDSPVPQNIGLCFPNLVSIDLSSCPNVTNELVKILCVACREIVSLKLEHCNNLTEEVCVFFDLLKKIDTLNLSFCSWVNQEICVYQFLQNVRELDLAGCENVSDEWVSCLASLPKLQNLSLSETQVTEEKIQELSVKFSNKKFLGSY